MHKHTEEQILRDSHNFRRKDRQMDRRKDRQMDRRKDRQMDRRRDRQTNIITRHRCHTILSNLPEIPK
jgi:hypothetical protein